jgi:hypothetical protein
MRRHNGEDLFVNQKRNTFGVFLLFYNKLFKHNFRSF